MDISPDLIRYVKFELCELNLAFIIAIVYMFILLIAADLCRGHDCIPHLKLAFEMIMFLTLIYGLNEIFFASRAFGLNLMDENLFKMKSKFVYVF